MMQDIRKTWELKIHTDEILFKPLTFDWFANLHNGVIT